MKDVLAAAQREVLEQFAWSHGVLAFDYDGTLAPIVADPAHAEPRPRTRALLARAAELYPVVVISGRSRLDTTKRLRGVRLARVIGNHGLEPWRGSERFSAQTQIWLPPLSRLLAGIDGLWIENKAFSLSIHYRASRARKTARAAILAAVSRLEGARVIGGKLVINVLPQGAPHKGVALERERARLGCDTALFVGDDQTDEDVFALDQPGRLLGIRVGARRASAAAYFIRDQAAIDSLLRRLIELRQPFAQRQAGGR